MNEYCLQMTLKDTGLCDDLRVVHSYCINQDKSFDLREPDRQWIDSNLYYGYVKFRKYKYINRPRRSDGHLITPRHLAVL